MLAGGLGVRSMGGSAFRPAEEGAIPGVTWPIRGPTTLEVSTPRSRDGLEDSGRRPDSLAAALMTICAAIAALWSSGRGEGLVPFGGNGLSDDRWATMAESSCIG